MSTATCEAVQWQPILDALIQLRDARVNERDLVRFTSSALSKRDGKKVTNHLVRDIQATLDIAYGTDHKDAVTCALETNLDFTFLVFRTPLLITLRKVKGYLYVPLGPKSPGKQPDWGKHSTSKIVHADWLRKIQSFEFDENASLAENAATPAVATRLADLLERAHRAHAALTLFSEKLLDGDDLLHKFYLLKER